MRGFPFEVHARGIGRQDHSALVQASTATMAIPALRQRVWASTSIFAIWTVPYPWGYSFVIPTPQDDGTFGWEAPSIIKIHYYVISITANSNHLTRVGLVRYASLAEYYAGIIAEIFPQVCAYGTAEIRYSKGITSKPGSLYAMFGSIYSNNAWEWIRVNAHGVLSELTPPWMSDD